MPLEEDFAILGLEFLDELPDVDPWYWALICGSTFPLNRALVCASCGLVRHQKAVRIRRVELAANATTRNNVPDMDDPACSGPLLRAHLLGGRTTK
jgi:hypothetical protein